MGTGGLCLLWNLGASQGERLSLQVGRPRGLPVPHRVEKAAGLSLLPVLSQVQPFMFFLRKSSTLSSQRTRLPCQQAQGYRSPGLSQGGRFPTETAWERLCSFWLAGVVVYLNVAFNPQSFHAAAHVGSGFSQESQKAGDHILPA